MHYGGSNLKVVGVVGQRKMFYGDKYGYGVFAFWRYANV